MPCSTVVSPSWAPLPLKDHSMFLCGANPSITIYLLFTWASRLALKSKRRRTTSTVPCQHALWMPGPGHPQSHSKFLKSSNAWFCLIHFNTSRIKHMCILKSRIAERQREARISTPSKKKCSNGVKLSIKYGTDTIRNPEDCIVGLTNRNDKVLNSPSPGLW